MEKFAVTHNNKEKKFETVYEGITGFLQYEIKDADLSLLHTEVHEKIGGKGVANALAAYAFDYAKTHDMKVIIYCAFIDAYVKRNPLLKSLVTEKENYS